MVAVSHFSDIGFAFDTANGASFGASLSGLMSNCQKQPFDDSDSICLIKDKSGAELRVGLKRNAKGAWEVQTANPAFSGEGRANVEITADVSDPEYKPFERNFSAHFAGDQAPIVFELSDPREATSFNAGAKIAIGITAFSYEPHLFSDEAAYMKSQPNEKVKFAANYFVPSGMFFERVGGAMEDGAKRPSPIADFAGTILKAELRTNSLGKKFWWTSVKTYGGALFDVVIDPASIEDSPEPGAVISGRFWLSARVAP